MAHRQSPIKIILSYPLTWIAVVEVALLEVAFLAWFHPPMLISGLAIGVGALFVVAWSIMFMRSTAFRQLYSQSPYKADRVQLEKMLHQSCTEAFRKPAFECLALLDKTRQEFRSQVFESDLERIFQNLVDLTQAHVQLNTRVGQFGTAEQKSTMQNILKHQVFSVENTLTALKSFSGNLTLLETHPEDLEKMGSDLKTINQELQKVIQEG